jgi:tripeptide aminopeptidase
MRKKIIDKFLRYVKINTQSSDTSETFPSTKEQFDLAKILVKELLELGLKDATVDKNCYVTATLEQNTEINTPTTVAFIAHLDTATNISGKNVRPQVYENYSGETIKYPKNLNITLSPEDNPYLQKCIGDTIITTDGTTLLGGDDKAGIAMIMTAIETLINNPEILHGKIKIAFTPDEEIGQGTKYFNIKEFGADFAYTIDGHMPGFINKETFSADMAVIKIQGKDIHPGEAKNVMINSIRVAADIIAKLPKDMAPETTEGYEPYIHPYELSGSIENAEIKILLRSFKFEELTTFKASIDKIISQVQMDYPKAKIDTEIKHQYKNMLEYLKDKPKALDILWKSVEETGISPEWEPIRGGTDGSQLSEKGLPTPNIFAGCENAHSAREYVSLNAMIKGTETLINIAKNITL